MGLDTGHPFIAAVFLSAFLLFQAELLVAKALLPRFGGTAAVWTTCLLFYQFVLLLAYFYAHALTKRLEPRLQRTLHRMVLLLSLGALALPLLRGGLPLLPSAGDFVVFPAESPAAQILLLLAGMVGIPAFMLAASGPLLQSWSADVCPGRSPYRLYSWSNLGSLLGLLTYPFVVELVWDLPSQARLWCAGYLGFGLALAVCALRTGGPAGQAAPAAAPLSMVDGSRALRARWFALALCPSILLLAVTNLLCQNLAVIPFLWVLPLALYLLSFVLCFESEGLYSRRWALPAMILATAMAVALLLGGAHAPIRLQIAGYSYVLLSVCLFCHGELYRLRPPASGLTLFYLIIAFGGACGGLFAALIAPLIFSGFWEYHIALALVWCLIVFTLIDDPGSAFYQGEQSLPFVFLLAAMLAAAGLAPFVRAGRAGWPPALAHAPFYAAAAMLLVPAFALGSLPTASRFHPSRPGWVRAILLAAQGSLLLALFLDRDQFLNRSLLSRRNFYGSLRVREEGFATPGHRYELVHGRVIHGHQYAGAILRRRPTSYFTEESGIGLAIRHHPRRRAGETSAGKPPGLHLGLVGLGIGAEAAYATPADHLRFYEINPEVVRIALQSPYFSYLRDCAAPVEIIIGDGRLSLEREAAGPNREPFDVLSIDAFSGDSVPVHLLTREAFELYRRLLRDESSILAFHISNQYLDLRPVIRSAALELGMSFLFIDHSDPGDPRVSRSIWALLGSRAALAPIPRTHEASAGGTGEFRPWTDAYSNPLGILK